MIIYNVTVNVEDTIHKDWLNYMKEVHIPDVMNTGCFEGYTFCRIITRQESETGETYAIQYRCSDMNAYNSYIDNHAESMRDDVVKKFGNNFYAFRTLLEEVI